MTAKDTIQILLDLLAKVEQVEMKKTASGRKEILEEESQLWGAAIHAIAKRRLQIGEELFRLR